MNLRRAHLHLLAATSALLGVGSLNEARAVIVDYTKPLPNATSYYAPNGTGYYTPTVPTGYGTLDASAAPHCAGICTMSTTLGTDPSISINWDQKVYDGVSGGHLEVQLDYFIDYKPLGNPTTTDPYSLNVAALDYINNPDGLYVYNELMIGEAIDELSSPLAYNQYGPYGTYYATGQFKYIALDQEDCSHPTAYCSTTPISGGTIQMKANTLYMVRMDSFIYANETGEQFGAGIDPTFSDNGQGGTFFFSPGIFNAEAAVPEPATWAMMIAGFGMIGGVSRRWLTRLQPGGPIITD